MDRMLYVAMSGANQVMLRQTTNNHNLANLNTVGFRSDFDTFVSRDYDDSGQATRVYAVRKGGAVSAKSGAVFTTGRELDIAIDRHGYISVQDDDGTEAYTRGGEFIIGPGGLLQTNSGFPVIGDGGPIAIPPHELLQISKDGTISIKTPGQTAGAMQEVDRIKLVSIDSNLVGKGANGLLKKTATPVFEPAQTQANGGGGPDRDNNVDVKGDAAGAEDGIKAVGQPLVAQADATVTITAGALESSNVNSIDALVNMVNLARQYEIQMKLMKTAEENETTATQVLQLN